MPVLAGWLGAGGRKPLVLRGARQVGKSTAVRLFAEEAGLDLLEVNLERHRDLDGVFGSFDVGVVLDNLSALGGKRVHERTLLFLDEIQAAPQAIACLRYFYENRPGLPVIAAGSLLEFALSKKAFPMPVGRITYHYMQPMCFSEFLAAVDPAALEWLDRVGTDAPMPEQAHKRLTKLQRQFMLVGGMPEAVACFAATGDFAQVASIQQGILNTCIEDFAKYARQKDLADLQRLFRTLPVHLGRKTVYARLLPDSTSAHSRALLDLLIKAQVATPVYAADCAGTPLRAGMDERHFKLLFLDVGLVTRLLGHDMLDIVNADERSMVNEGPLAEQFIGQHLYLDERHESPPESFYWLNSAKNANAEVDFVVAQGRLMVPVKVKAGKSGSLKSLHYFCGIRHLAHAVRFDLLPASVQRIQTSIVRKGDDPVLADYQLHSLPLYAVEKLPQLLSALRSTGRRFCLRLGGSAGRLIDAG
ncbi:MAG: ATP-binding protein [Oceanipulchritudo sp.]